MKTNCRGRTGFDVVMIVNSACRVFCCKLVNQITKQINAETINSVGASFFAALFTMFAGMAASLRRRKDSELSFAF